MPRKPTGRPTGRPVGSGRLGLGTQDEHTRLTVRIPNTLYTRLEAFAEGRSYSRGTPQLAGCVRALLEHALACPYKRQTQSITTPERESQYQPVSDPAQLSDEIQQTESTPPVLLDTEALDAMPLAPDTPPVDMPRQTVQSATPVVPGLAPVPADTPRAQRRALLLSAVPWEADTPGGISPADLRRATGLRKIDATNDLDDLRKHGQVVKVSQGLYVRPGPAPVTKE